MQARLAHSTGVRARRGCAEHEVVARIGMAQPETHLEWVSHRLQSQCYSALCAPGFGGPIAAARVDWIACAVGACADFRGSYGRGEKGIEARSERSWGTVV